MATGRGFMIDLTCEHADAAQVGPASKRSSQVLKDVTNSRSGTGGVEAAMAAVKDNTQVEKCPVCEMVIGNMFILQRQIHMNACMDDVGLDPLKRRNYMCAICCESFCVQVVQGMDITKRMQHVRSCGKKHGVRSPGALRKKAKRKISAVETDDKQVDQIHRKNFGSLLTGRARSVDGGQKRMSKKSIAKPTYHPVANLASAPACKRVPGCNGFIIDGFGFSGKYYFLTHFHSDHFGGLSRSFQGTIFCTPITARLVTLRFGISRSQIKVIEIGGEPVCVENAKVFAFEANHCPGAAMFLFQVDNKAYLHTGDFRYDRNRISIESILSFPCILDTVYIDTTYCNPRDNFISQPESIRLGIQCVKTEQKLSKGQPTISNLFGTRENRTVIDSTFYVFGAYQLGKERFMLDVLDGCFPSSTKVYVSKDRLSTIKCLDGSNDIDVRRFTAKLDGCQAALVSMKTLSSANLIKLKRSIFNSKAGRAFTKLVAFKPTGWANRLKKTYLCTDVTLYAIPYSEHSSYAELGDFIQDVCERTHSNCPQFVPTVGAPEDHLRSLISCTMRNLPSPN